MSKDIIKIDQDLKILMQTLVEKAVLNAGEGMTFNVIGQINVHNEKIKSKKALEAGIPKIKRLEIGPGDPERLVGQPREILDKVQELLDILPNPKLDYLIGAVFEQAVMSCKTQRQVADYLGIKEGKTHEWIRRLGLNKRLKFKRINGNA